MTDLVALPASAAEQDVADRRWLSARLGDARREVLAARRWAWQLDGQRESLAQDVARLEAELASVRAVQARQPRLSLVPDVEVPLGWPDAFPTVHRAPLVDEVHDEVGNEVGNEVCNEVCNEVTEALEVPVVNGALALAPAVADHEQADAPRGDREWPASTGAWGRRRGALAVTVLPSGASRKERRARHGRRG